jgi:hypothetical protein
MKFRKYSIEFKLKCLEMVKIFGIYKTSKCTKIDKKCIKYWIKNKEKFQNIIDKKNTFRLPSKGSLFVKSDKEIEIINCILKCKEIGIPINTNLIVDELIRIIPELKKYSRITLKKWCYKFYKRYYFNIFELKKKVD